MDSARKGSKSGWLYAEVPGVSKSQGGLNNHWSNMAGGIFMHFKEVMFIDCCES